MNTYYSEARSPQPTSSRAAVASTTTVASADVRKLARTAGSGDLDSLKKVDYDADTDEVHLSFQCGDQDTLVPVDILCGDLDLYPDSRHYFIGTTDASESHIRAVSDVQQEIQNVSESYVLRRVVQQIITRLEALDPKQPIYIDSDDSDNSDDDDDEEVSFDIEVQPDFFPAPVIGAKRRRPGHALPNDSGDSVAGRPAGLRPGARPADRRIARYNSSTYARKMRIAQDLKAVYAAGYFFGLVDDTTADEYDSIMTISVKIATLNLSLQMLLAWDLHPEMYYVLLIHFSQGYVPYEPLLGLTNLDASLAFRIGKCTHYKPTAKQAYAAFGLDCPQPRASDPSVQFSKILISSALGKLMSESFLTILRFRNRRGCTWSDALKLVMNPPSMYTEQHGDVDVAPVSAGLNSLPLLAMEFAVERLRNYTKSCQSCFNELDKSWLTLKPTICSRDLCSYQHIQIGLTQYLEYEIICQPAVIDLLINICYVALTSYIAQPTAAPAIRTFPSGLRLRLPDTTNPHQGFLSQTDSKRYSVVLRSGGIAMSDTTAAGKFCKHQWVAIADAATPAATPLALWHMEITDVDYVNSTLYLTSYNDATDIPAAAECCVYAYTRKIEELDDLSKSIFLRDILDTLPPVDRMKTLLEDPLVGSLHSIRGVSPSAVALLENILATNRSCIMQITNQNLKMVEYTLGGWQLPAGWLQFGVFHGPPDHEAEFERNLSQCLASGRIASRACPTLLAWHGSRVQNWHSILRTGLDYNVTANGRVYGDGVYFSPYFQTSMAYTKTSTIPQWPHAVMDLGSMLSLNEIINSPRDFHSCSPHYVLRQRNWSRCRFLFAQAKSRVPSSWSQTQDTAVAAPVTMADYFTEDAAARVHGPQGGMLAIPLASMPQRISTSQGDASGTRLATAGQDLAHTMDAADLAFLQPEALPIEVVDADADAATQGDSDDSDDDDMVITKVVTVARRAYIEISDDDDGARQSAPKRQKTRAAARAPVHINTNVLPFVPGTLDHGTLPVMAPPSWGTASAQRVLASGLHELQKIQAATPLPNLGWYMDFGKVDNLFQWVFELHSFDNGLPLAAGMRQHAVNAIVMEMRFGPDFPITPPFVRVIRPRFLPFLQGGGGHITAGGSVCMELLTGSGWLPGYELSSVLMQVHLALSTAQPPARLEASAGLVHCDYGIHEAVAGYRRSAQTHGWTIPADMEARLRM